MFYQLRQPGTPVLGIFFFLRALNQDSILLDVQLYSLKVEDRGIVMADGQNTFT